VTVVLDLTGVSCPLTFAKTTVALDGIASGAVLDISLDAGEPAEQVPRSLELNGHTVLQRAPRPDGGLRIWVRKA
jgi:TusA-related sulfurtransferase